MQSCPTDSLKALRLRRKAGYGIVTIGVMGSCRAPAHSMPFLPWNPII